MQLPITINECYELLKEQQEVITELRAMLLNMSLRIKDLENQLNQNTHNNHRSPSCDGYRKKPSFEGKLKGLGGGKSGHDGNTLKMVGTAVYNCLPVYLTYIISFHSICGAHLLRELTALKAQGGHWSELMHQLLMQLYEASDKGQGKVKNIKILVSRNNQICKIADEEEPPHQQGPGGRVKQMKGRNLLGRLTKYRRYIFAFAAFRDIPFSNNMAERELRPAKIKQKVSVCFRTRAGAQRFAHIRSFISTARKQSRYVFNELVNAINGQTIVLQLAVGGT